MTGNEVALIITSAATLVTSIGGIVLGLVNRTNIKEVHASTNGKMDQLLHVVKKSSFAEGVKSQKDNPE
jgi:uncharacterized membrane protein